MPELLLPRLKREIEARLAELRPVVAEAERLVAAKDALLAEAAAADAARQRAVRAAQRQPRNGVRLASLNGASAELRAGAASAPGANGANGANGTNGAAAAARPAGAEEADDRAGRGTSQEAILSIVEERPGVSVAEIASVTKIAKPTVATTVSKLKREGVLADEAGGVKLASRQPLTLSQAAAPQRDEGVSDEEWEAARRDPAAA